MNYAVTFKT